jgi:hypothetical protein
MARNEPDARFEDPKALWNSRSHERISTRWGLYCQVASFSSGIAVSKVQLPRCGSITRSPDLRTIDNETCESFIADAESSTGFSAGYSSCRRRVHPQNGSLRRFTPASGCIQLGYRPPIEFQRSFLASLPGCRSHEQLASQNAFSTHERIYRSDGPFRR